MAVHNQSNTKFTFSGHDSFECRKFWLKKGYELIIDGGKFNDEAVVSLGVGKNMVTAIRYWLRSFGVFDETDELTEFAKQLLDNKGLDPYFEDEATLWLLHYKLVVSAYASIYSIIFNDFRRIKPEFTKDHLFAYIKTKYKDDLNEATFSKDFEAFTKTYVSRKDDAEENYDGLLSELNLVNEKEKREDKKRVFIIEPTERESLPISIILYCILEQQDGVSIGIEALYEPNNVGTVFAINRQGLSNKLKEIQEIYGKKYGIVFKDEAGIKELQFTKGRPDSTEILTNYYLPAYVA